MQPNTVPPSAARGSAPLLVALLVLVLGLGLTAFAVDTAQRRLESATWYHFSLQFDRLEASISEQLTRPLTGMQALIGLYQANRAFTTQSFHAWVASQDMSQQYQGVLGFGLLERAGTWRVKYFEPTPAIPLLAPPAGATETLETVVNNGEPALWPMTDKDFESGKTSEYLYLVPIYHPLPAYPSTAQRQQALVGLVFARIDLNALLLPSLALAERWTDFDIIDRTHGKPATLVYSSTTTLIGPGASVDSSQLAQRQFTNHRAMVLGGRVLELKAGSTAGFDAERDRDTPPLVGAAGALLSLLLAVIFWQLMAARMRAQKLAIRMTSDLNRLAHVVRRTTHLVFMGDARQHLVWVNDAFTRFTGVEFDAAIGAELGRVIDLQSSNSVGLAALREALAQHKELRDQIPITSNQGQQRWFDIDLQPEHDRHGNYTGFIVIAADVSDQKRLQADLRQNNQVMQSIMANIPVALSVFDGDLKLIARNDKFGELLEFPASLFAGPTTHFEQLIRYNATRGEYGHDNVEQQVQRIVEAARHTVHHQFERSRPNGMSLEIRGAPMPGGGFVTTYADITARKQAEADLQRTTRMLQSVLDSASEVAVVTLDLQHHITLFNKGAERLLGYTAEQAIGHLHPEVFFDPAEFEARSSAISAQLNRQVLGLQSVLDESVLGKRGEWTYIHQDGHRFAAALVVTALTDANGEHTGYLCVSHDITQEKEHETRLQIAMEEAEQASTAKGQFLANMSHEIRTPMNAILGMLKLLQNTALDPRQQDYATKTESAARSLLGLLNDILDYSKAEAGKMQLDAQPFRLDAILRDLSVILSANIGTKGIEVLFDVDPKIPAGLIGDSMRLQQILINLTGNAIKFTAHGEVVVSVQLRAHSPQSVCLHFAVRDSGIGIDPRHQQHIFSGFSQAEASTTRRFGGTGLGLSICRRLVSLMGGELLLDSSRGVGSNFHFTLELPLSPVLEASAPPASTPPRHALLVEDNALARHCIAQMAASLGWEVAACDSADAAAACIEARQHNQQSPFQALLIDWTLPDTDSLDATRRLLALQNHPATLAIVMVTAHDREALALRAEPEKTRVDGFLVKPMTASMLDDALRSGETHRTSPQALRQRSLARPRRLAGLRLLVVEDNLINQQVAKELLGAEGASIDLAGNGLLGVEAVSQAKPQYDAVLMDIQMPVMDGYTASVTIRHELGLHSLPIIAMTANAMASDREACLAAGMNDHIGKPFDLPHLVDILCRHTRRNPHHDDLIATDMPSTSDASPTPRAAAGALATTLRCEEALSMLGDNVALFLQIGNAYLVEISELPQKMDALLESGQWADAARVFHTIKGLSLTVGASDMAALCRQFEQQIKEQNHADHTLTAALRREVDATHKALSALMLQWQVPVSATHTPPADPTGDPATLVADLHALRALLTQSDLNALEVHNALRQRHTFAANQLQDLQASLLAFDFSKAVVQCGELIREFDPQK